MAYVLNELSAELKTVLQTVQVDSESVLPASAIYEYPTTQFAGNIAAVILPSENENDYATTRANRRRYVLTVFLYVVLESQSESSSYALARKLVDAVMDVIDNSQGLNNKADFVVPAPSQWGQGSTQGGTAIIAPVTVACEKLVSVTP